MIIYLVDDRLWACRACIGCHRGDTLCGRGLFYIERLARYAEFECHADGYGETARYFPSFKFDNTKHKIILSTNVCNICSICSGRGGICPYRVGDVQRMYIAHIESAKDIY